MRTETDSYRLEQLIEGLSVPAAYPHVVHNIEVVQTHISCVFLTGDFAYKIKKPVSLGFLDFRQLDDRRVLCKEEILLNSRLCPDLYQDVVPITRDELGLHVDGAGAPIEWAVRMRQLDPDQMLCTRLANSAVSTDDIRAIAAVLADFHSRTRSTPEIREWGVHAVISRTILNTLDTMDRLAETFLDSPARDSIRAYLKSFLDTERELFCRRSGDGSVRDCHGDLRTQNVCLDPRFSNGIQIFDCIEFNQEFRYIDVAADLAYLAMDLDLAGRTDLRSALFDYYSRRPNDPELQCLLPFYQAYRACVRGNIALFAASEHEMPNSEREEQREIAAAAYDLALCYASDGARPALMITVGFSGSGKSALAHELSRRLPADVISTDQVRKEREAALSTKALPVDRYAASRRAEVYQELYRRAAALLSARHYVVLDGTFLSEQERENAARLAQKTGARFCMVECRCSDPVIRRRLAWRQTQSSASEADVPVYEHQVAAFTPIELPRVPGSEAACHIIADTEQPSQHAAHHVIDCFTRVRHTAS
jgi:aminoglycoside phosphotransferase family enzyme/predicted kinase